MWSQADGVLLGGVQALYSRVKSQDEKIEALEADLIRANAAAETASEAARTARVRAEEMEARMTRLEKLLLDAAK